LNLKNIPMMIKEHNIVSIIIIVTAVVEFSIACHILTLIFTSNIVAQALSVYSLIQWAIIPALFILIKIEPINKLVTALEASAFPLINLVTIELAMINFEGQISAIAVIVVWSALAYLWPLTKLGERAIPQLLS